MVVLGSDTGKVSCRDTDGGEDRESAREPAPGGVRTRDVTQGGDAFESGQFLKPTLATQPHPQPQPYPYPITGPTPDGNVTGTPSPCLPHRPEPCTVEESDPAYRGPCNRPSSHSATPSAVTPASCLLQTLLWSLSPPNSMTSTVSPVCVNHRLSRMCFVDRNQLYNPVVFHGTCASYNSRAQKLLFTGPGPLAVYILVCTEAKKAVVVPQAATVKHAPTIVGRICLFFPYGVSLSDSSGTVMPRSITFYPPPPPPPLVHATVFASPEANHFPGCQTHS